MFGGDPSYFAIGDASDIPPFAFWFKEEKTLALFDLELEDVAWFMSDGHHGAESFLIGPFRVGGHNVFRYCSR